MKVKNDSVEIRCGTIDIRNNPSHVYAFGDAVYSESENGSAGRRTVPITECTVLEGDLRVTMMTAQNNTPESFPVFRKLREITGYMLVFQVRLVH